MTIKITNHHFGAVKQIPVIVQSTINVNGRECVYTFNANPLSIISAIVTRGWSTEKAEAWRGNY